MGLVGERSPAMREQNEIEGLGVVHLDLVGRYVAAAAGPPPRTPLRFWNRGEWIEVSSPEPEPNAVPGPGPARLEEARAVDPWSAVRARELPVYRWVLERVTDNDEQGGPEPGRPRSVALASGSGRPIGRRPAP
jgi:hypothetical protein